ncbi:hypothetical protein N356_gp095 [Cellulophaga phage phi14:2]|uniref:Uncharacterized protein n=1 Tax=Cellulophaga phage phi14:2 TaxID=1327990 RepID=S0A3I7_9CAUD|nr:hypothetical protein N356_gp095 [Cellulophaga phage phi14:2]AGO48987.1 hypothetical protein Phi14:2_gp109 [Cellulophaga phage phi14:2]
MKNETVANINTNFNGLIRKWVSFTHPFHKLAPQEQETLTALLIFYFKFKKTIKDEDVVWKMVFDYDTRAKMGVMINSKDYTLQNNLTKLRKKKVLKDNKVVPNFIPNIEPDCKNFKLIYNFTVKND